MREHLLPDSTGSARNDRNGRNPALGATGLIGWPAFAGAIPIEPRLIAVRQHAESPHRPRDQGTSDGALSICQHLSDRQPSH